MRIKKVNPDWFPAENKELKVGEIIEITDPKSLILSGYGVAVTKEGTEISAYDLYGVIVANEKEEFKQWLAMKRQQGLKKQLEQEQKDLKEKLEVTQPEAREVATTPTDGKLSWIELVEKAKEVGVYKVGMNRAEIEAAFKEPAA